MDLHVIGPLATPAERAAVEASSGRRSAAGSAVRGDRARGHAARGGHAARARRSPAAGAPRAPGPDRLDQPAGAQLHLPATLGRRRPRPTASPRSMPCSRRSRGRRSWPTSATTSPAGSPGRRRSVTTWRGRSGRTGEAARDGQVDGIVRPASACASLRRRRWSRPPASAATVTSARRSTRRGSSRVSTARRSRARHRPAARRPASRTAAPRRVGVVDPASLDDYRAHGGYAALAQALAIGPRGRHRRGHGVEARGPRRRGLPDRPQVGRRRRRSRPSPTTSCATPTSRSRARSRTACSWRATRSRSSRR